MRKVFFCALLSTFWLALSSLQAAVNLDQMMSDQEKKQTGISNLTPAQKQALGSWIDRNFTPNMAQMPSSNNQLSLSVNINNGKQLVLSDGSLWEVSPSDYSISSVWVTPFPLQIMPSQDPNYPWILLNTTTKEQVKAKKLKSGPN